MALYGPFLSTLRGMEQGTIQSACSRLSGEPTLYLQEETLSFLVDTVMALEEQGLGLALKRPSRVGQIGNQHSLKEVRLRVVP
jgi:hypothetical protein